MDIGAIIINILREQDHGIKTGTAAMLAILEEMQQQVMTEIGRAAVESWDYYFLQRMLPAIERQVDNFRQKAQLEAAGLLKQHWGLGQSLVDAPIAAAQPGIYMGFHLGTASLDALRDFTVHKLADISNDAYARIRSELQLGIMAGKSPAEVAKAIGRDLESPSVFRSIAYRAEVVTRTEMGRVFSKATEMRLEQAALVIPGMEKEWIHAGHPMKPRPTHLAAHGQRVPVAEPFRIGAQQMMFPRDPAAPLDEVINCGCDHVPWNPSWGAATVASRIAPLAAVWD